MTGKGHKKPLNRSITIGCIIFIVLLCILLVTANLRIYRNYVYDDYREYIADILDLTAAHIDGDDLRTCIETGKESETYKETLLYMDDLINHIDDIHYLYAVLPLNTDDRGNMMSVLSAERYYDRYIDTKGNLYLGWISDDEFDAETAEKFSEIMKSQDITYFEEKTEWGTDYTGAMAIKDSSGKSVAVLAVDIDISFFDDMIMHYARVNILIVIIAGGIFICLFLLWSRRNITKPIRELERQAVGFADRSHGQRDVDALIFKAPELKTDNEIKSLSDAVVKMTQDMRDYVEEIVNAEGKAADLHRKATRDALTGVWNKAAYDEEISRIEAQIQEGNTDTGLAVVDLNGLKMINDSYGHDKGNTAIQILCRLICEIFRRDAVFRIGGDEFVIILHGQELKDFDRLREGLEEELRVLADDDRLEPWEKVSAAIGAAFYDREQDDCFEDVFRRADSMMYERKKEMKAAAEGKYTR